MRSLFELFAKSPFGPLQDHMRKAVECAKQVPPLFKALEEGNETEFRRISELIERLESDADTIKNTIRGDLPKTIFTPVDRKDLLDILSTQDSISDSAEDVMVLLNWKKFTIPAEIRAELWGMISQVMVTVDMIEGIGKELDELVEASFGGPEAEKVLTMIDRLGTEEFNADRKQHTLVRKLISLEGKISTLDIVLWMKVFKRLGDIANNAEKAGNRIRLFFSK